MQMEASLVCRTDRETTTEITNPPFEKAMVYIGHLEKKKHKPQIGDENYPSMDIVCLFFFGSDGHQPYYLGVYIPIIRILTKVG